MLKAGVAITDVTPPKPMFLHGYPHVERISVGVHDPLYASALVLDNGEMQIGFCAVDVVFISGEIAKCVRERVQAVTGIPGQNIMISASHTHTDGLLACNSHFRAGRGGHGIFHSDTDQSRKY